MLAYLRSEEILSKVPQEELFRKLVSEDNLEFRFAPHKNQQGLPLSSDESRLLNEGKLARTYFQNKEGKIKEVRCYSMTETREIDEARLTSLLSSNPLAQLNQISIDCSENTMEMIYRKVIEADTMHRSELLPPLEDSTEDEIVVSIIEQCRFPIKPKTVEAAWHVIFRSSINGLREFYYSEFKEAFESGLLSCENFVDLEDKIMKRRSFKPKSEWKFENRDAFFDFLDKKNEFPDINIEDYIKTANTGPIEFVVETN